MRALLTTITALGKVSHLFKCHSYLSCQPNLAKQLKTKLSILRSLFSLKPKKMAKMRLLAVWIDQRQSFKIAKKTYDVSYTERYFETK